MSQRLCGYIVMGILVTGCAHTFAAAPVLSPLPDVIIGDLEDSTTATDTNIFRFPDAFRFDNFAADADTSSSALAWSFGEFDGGLGTGQYLVNGKAAINQGDQAIAEDQENGNANALTPGDAFNIRLGEETASFRDIILSPLPEQAAYSAPTENQVTSARSGKIIRYYVSDGVSVAVSDAFIRTFDEDFDSTAAEFSTYEEVFRMSSGFPGDWTDQGLPWAAVSNSYTSEQLQITVHPTRGKSRIFGWRNSGLIDYDTVGADKFVRGKFYIYTDVSILAPLNQVPNFRIGLMNEDAVRAMTHFELAATGASDPGYEPFYASTNNPPAENFTNWLRPADNRISPTPSLYRIDFDPVDVPAAAGSTIGAFMESYTVADPANGSLFLSEIVLGTYDALDNSGQLEWAYYRTEGLNSSAGGEKTLSGGAFNHEANLTPGYLQDLYFEGTDPGGFFTLEDESVAGIVGDTDTVEHDVFGVGLMNLESINNVDKLRIAPNTLYHARFYATAAVPADSNDPNVESQGLIRFRFQTVANRVSYLLETMTAAINSLVGPNTPNADAIAAQALPGIGSLNPDTNQTLNPDGEDGGWYSVVVPSPMDVGGIRNDVETLFETEQNTFFVLSTEPGPGEAGDSARDVLLGVDLIQAPVAVTVFDGNFEIARPNRAQIRLSAIEVYSYPAIDDGGFDYSSPQ